MEKKYWCAQDKEGNLIRKTRADTTAGSLEKLCNHLGLNSEKVKENGYSVVRVTLVD